MLIPFAFAVKNQTWEKRDCGVSGIGERNYFGFLFFGSRVTIYIFPEIFFYIIWLILSSLLLWKSESAILRLWSSRLGMN